MSLPPGTRLGACEVVAPLGAGGMGEVYRARDGKLDRQVAIKVLPEAFAHDAGRLARFTREAHALAALNHPNIAQIHGLEESGGVRALVMELVEGDDLSVHLARGSLPLGEALPIARQIAEALEAAHEHGIVHRDLKPANVMLRHDGAVKVLDFGLAKAMDAADAEEVARSPTISAPATAAGAILGTAAYMAPEQARGKPVDRRADIWAFGVVLYEMLTGRHLFGGDSTSDVLAAVLTREPDWSALPSGCPHAIVRLLRRCLERDPKKRLRDIGEAVLVLADPAAAEASLPPAAKATRRERIAWTATAVAVVIAIAVWHRAPVRGTDAPAPGPVHFTLPIDPGGLAVDAPAIAPDGLRVAFVGHMPGTTTESIFVRSLREANAVLLPGTDGVSSTPRFSPDGRWLAFVVSSHTLRKVPVEGGAPTTLAEGNLRCNCPAWIDDRRILLPQFDPDHLGVLYQVSDTGGPPTPLPGRPERATEEVWDAQVLPGDRVALLATGSADPTRPAALAAQSLETGERRVLVPNATWGRALGKSVVWWDEGRLRAAPFDAERLVLAGAPADVPTDGIHGERPYSLDVSANGSLIFFRQGKVPLRAAPETPGAAATWGLVWIDRQGTRTPVANGDELWEPRLSRDGTRAAVVDEISTGNSDAWTIDLGRGARSRISFGPDEDETALWSPDGAWIAWASSSAGAKRALRRRRSDGSGSEETLWVSDGRHFHADSWIPDGNGILLGVTDPKTGMDVVLLSLGEKPTLRPLLSDRFNESSARVSPDGHWFVYVSDESGRPEVYAQALPDLGRKVQISVAGGVEPIWHPRGGEIVYRAATSRVFMSVAVATGETLVPAAPRVLCSDAGVARGAGDHTAYDVAPDGRLLAVVEASADVRPALHFVLGWGQAAGLVH